jgi:hypothetical protein
MGGLGNQMFQYAAARNLSIKFNKKLYIDTSSFDNNNIDTYRRYELNNFNIKAEIADRKIYNLFFGSSFNFINKFILKILKFGRYKKIDIPLTNTSVWSFSNIGSVYLRGFFQNEAYFLENQHQIISDFTLNEIPNNRYVNEIVNIKNSISVHVRRGDYINNKLAIDVLGAKDFQYYLDAIELLKLKLQNEEICFFIFSDDIEWCKNNLVFDGNKRYIDDVNNSITEFYLMSICKHNIISNSTYSWWSAYLNKNIDKIIIAPKIWFRNVKYKNEGIIPKNWIKL